MRKKGEKIDNHDHNKSLWGGGGARVDPQPLYKAM